MSSAVGGNGTLTGCEGKLAHAYDRAAPALAPFSATQASIGGLPSDHELAEIRVRPTGDGDTGTFGVRC